MAYGEERYVAVKIEHYSFGKIIIDGKSYTSDVIIYPDRVSASWWRKEGHNLNIIDLSDVIKSKPDILVVGSGYSGSMKVPQETLKHLESEGISVKVSRSSEAVELFNTLQTDKKVVAALHLTC